MTEFHICIFFFKQKKAYEMRISDWSSDVCSYDLLAYAETALRDRRPDWPMALPANPLPEPDLSDALRHDVVFNGGMMGGMIMQEMGGSMGDDSSEEHRVGKECVRTCSSRCSPYL